MFASKHSKKMLIVGAVLLAIGIILIALPFVLQPEVITSGSVNTVLSTAWYSSDRFQAEKGSWLDLDIKCDVASHLFVKGQIVGQIYEVFGTSFKYNVSILATDVYAVEIQNGASQHVISWWSDKWIFFNNTLSGNFYLKKTPSYYATIQSSGRVFAIAGSVLSLAIVSVAVYKELDKRRKAKSVSRCKRCGKEVKIGTEVCPFCGLDLTKYWVRCRYCGKLFDVQHEKCPKCGAEV